MSERRPRRTPDEKYKRCRTVGHHWHEATPGPDQRPPSYGTLMLWRCDGCTGFRYDIVQWPGGEAADLLSRWYDPPPDYKDVISRTRAEWRAYYLNKTRPGITELDDARARRKEAHG